MEQITRQIEWNVTLWMQVFLYVGAFAGVLIAGWRLTKRYRVWKLGRSPNVQVSIPRSLANVLAWILNRGKMPRDGFASLMHFLILWGFLR